LLQVAPLLIGLLGLLLLLVLPQQGLADNCEYLQGARRLCPITNKQLQIKLQTGEIPTTSAPSLARQSSIDSHGRNDTNWKSHL
jgi:hypothetical protein